MKNLKMVDDRKKHERKWSTYIKGLLLNMNTEKCHDQELTTKKWNFFHDSLQVLWYQNLEQRHNLGIPTNRILLLSI